MKRDQIEATKRVDLDYGPGAWAVTPRGLTIYADGEPVVELHLTPKAARAMAVDLVKRIGG